MGTVVGFPHGCSDTGVKLAETESACREGAAEIDMLVNVGKVLSEDWARDRGDLGGDTPMQRGAEGDFRERLPAVGCVQNPALPDMHPS